MKTTINSVGVIVPVWNTPPWMLEQCLNSILRQSYSVEEIIVINDGSDDEKTNLFLEEYANLYQKIKYINAEHGGISYARNLGLKALNSDSFIFVDSDDFIDENYVEKHVKKMNETGANIVRSGYKESSFEGTETYNNIPTLEEMEMPFYEGTAGMKLYRTSFIIQNKIVFPEGCIGEDHAFILLAMSQKEYNSVCLDNWGYNVRRRKDSFCRDRRNFNRATVKNTPLETYRRIYDNTKMIDNNERVCAVRRFITEDLNAFAWIFSTYSSWKDKKKLTNLIGSMFPEIIYSRETKGNGILQKVFLLGYRYKMQFINLWLINIFMHIYYSIRK